MRKRTVLVTGATGYMGGRLVPALVDRGYHVRCLVRQQAKARGRFTPSIEIAGGDLLQPHSLSVEQFDAGAAYYLVHALASRSNLREEETAGATNFVHSARQAGVERLIYLGGLGSPATSRYTWRRATTWGASCMTAGFRRSSCAPPSSWDPEVCRSR